MTLPADTILAVAGIVAGVTGLSWLAYEWAPILFSDLREHPESDWSSTPWGDVAELPADLKSFQHVEIFNTEGKRDHA